MNNNPNSNSSVLSVLSGKDPIKMEISIDYQSMAILGLTVMIAVAVGVFIASRLKP